MNVAMHFFLKTSNNLIHELGQEGDWVKALRIPWNWRHYERLEAWQKQAEVSADADTLTN